MNAVLSLPTLEQLQTYVHQTLCDTNALDPSQTPLRQKLIKRWGKPCGLFFEAAGPRLMRAYAIWAGEENRILFYDTAGRKTEVKLSDSPDPLRLAG